MEELHLRELLRARGLPVDPECGRGWFSILDALCDVLGDKVRYTRQVKEKFGGLRFYGVTSEREFGAVRLADEFSYRVCEDTGRPGRLMYNAQKGWYRTLASGVRGEFRERTDDVRTVGKRELTLADRLLTPPLGLTGADVAERWHETLQEPLPAGSPEGWADLLDATLGYIACVPGTEPKWSGVRATVHPLSYRFVIALAGPGNPSARYSGAAAFAEAMSARIDPGSGDAFIPA